MRKDDCIFCKLANGVFPTNKIYEDENFTVILDASPANPGHCLIIPKQHFDCLFRLDDELAAKVMPLAKKIGAVIKAETGADGINVVQNNGTAAGKETLKITEYPSGTSVTTTSVALNGPLLVIIMVNVISSPIE